MLSILRGKPITASFFSIEFSVKNINFNNLSFFLEYEFGLGYIMCLLTVVDDD
jgi:hypothetical protein